MLDNKGKGQRVKGKAFFLLLSLAFVIYHLSFIIPRAFALSQECSVSTVPQAIWDKCIDEIKREVDALKPAHESNQKELASLRKQLTDIKSRITSLNVQVNNLAADIVVREEDLAVQEELLGKRVHEFYIRSRQYSPVLVFLASNNATELARELMLRSEAASEDKRVISELATKLIELKTDKETLEKSRAGLTGLQKQIDSNASFLAGEVKKVETYLTTLSSKQQEILSAKAGSFITSVGDVELADDYNASIKGFRESAPSGSFAVFSFGGYTHRKGMSQYGARGRAENGQNFKQILQAYYGKEPVSKDTGGDINVTGYGAINFEEKYLYGIAEMPSGWNVEALKAQAVAARTYAYRYKVDGKTICATESCQVFNKSKSDNPPASWKAAVDATRGQVLEDVVTYYASTSGGYINTMGWDTTDGSGGGDFITKAWESKGGSPWLYKAWYRKGYTSSGATCGESNPWLNNEELSDIVNAALVLKNRGDDRITPVVCGGGNPYSHAELRDAAREYGGISSVSSITVHQGNGITSQVTINGNITLSGTEFKRGYNVRAPGYLKIPQGTGFGSSTDFAFFNIEKK